MKPTTIPIEYPTTVQKLAGMCSKKVQRAIVTELTGLPWAVYLKRRFFAKRYRGREHCVALAISKRMAKHLAELYNEELEEMRALVRADRDARRRK